MKNVFELACVSHLNLRWINHVCASSETRAFVCASNEKVSSRVRVCVMMLDDAMRLCTTPFRKKPTIRRWGVFGAESYIVQLTVTARESFNERHPLAAARGLAHPPTCARFACPISPDLSPVACPFSCHFRMRLMKSQTKWGVKGGRVRNARPVRRTGARRWSRGGLVPTPRVNPWALDRSGQRWRATRGWQS